MKRMTTVGIIGFGSFGQFLVEKLGRRVKIKVFSPSGKHVKKSGTLAAVAECDYLILSIPLEGYEHMLKELKPLLSPSTVIVDICSVKEEPARIIRKIIPHQPVVFTHPLFGPESAKKSMAGHTLVLCPADSDPGPLAQIKKYALKRKLNVVEMTAREHDKEMASIHGLTFFIAHALKDMDLHKQVLSTPTFRKLLALAEIERHHSQKLFMTIQKGNPHTKAIRRKFQKEVDKLNKSIDR